MSINRTIISLTTSCLISTTAHAAESCNIESFKDHVSSQSEYLSKLVYVLATSEKEFSSNQVKANISSMLPEAPVSAGYGSVQHWAHQTAKSIGLDSTIIERSSTKSSHLTELGLRAITEVCGNGYGLRAYLKNASGNGASISVRYIADTAQTVKLKVVHLDNTKKAETAKKQSNNWSDLLIKRNPEKAEWVSVIVDQNLPPGSQATTTVSILIPPDPKPGRAPQCEYQDVETEEVVSHASAPAGNPQPQTGGFAFGSYLAPGDWTILAAALKDRLEGNGAQFRSPSEYSISGDRRSARWRVQVESGPGFSGSAYGKLQVKLMRCPTNN